MKINDKTFMSLDREMNSHPVSIDLDDELPLPTWYRSIMETPLSQLEVGDLSKAIRQNIHLMHVVPFAVDHLVRDPVAGDVYDGELLCSMASIPSHYWAEHPEHSTVVKEAVGKVINVLNDDERTDLQRLLKSINSQAI